MRELFRLKIASKRQATVPQKLLNLLHLSEGDEIRIETENGQITKAEPCKVVPTSLFSADILTELVAREAVFEEGGGTSIDPAKLIEEAEAQTADAAPRVSAAG
jgi:antitoxin component of MazEF toxin-antitoxin module